MSRPRLRGLQHESPDGEGGGGEETLSSVLSNDTFVYLTTSEMRTPHYSGHFNLTRQCHENIHYYMYSYIRTNPSHAIILAV